MYTDAVTEEVDMLTDALRNDPARMARRALLFALATPKRDEQVSIAWALTVESFYGTLDARDLAHMTYVSLTTGNTCRIGMNDALERSIRDSEAIFPRLCLADITPDTLTRVYGIGPKVARMASAVANPHANIFTVDMWHARQLLWAAGMDYVPEVGVSAAAYPTLEKVWHEYRQRFFPDTPMWVCQWATWNAAKGRHESHSALWSDLA